MDRRELFLDMALASEGKTSGSPDVSGSSNTGAEEISTWNKLELDSINRNSGVKSSPSQINNTVDVQNFYMRIFWKRLSQAIRTIVEGFVHHGHR
jgi:hypothetical protein